MPLVEFNRFSATYEAHLDTPALRAIGGASSRAFTELKCRELLRLLKERGLSPPESTVIDAGCGTGTAEEYLASHFKKMVGVDCSSGMIDQARRKEIPKTDFTVADASAIPLPDRSAQAIFSFCIFHHADPRQIAALLAESKRLLAPGGILAIFEHNPWNPLTRYVVQKCPVDVEVNLISAPRLRRWVKEAGFEDLETRFIVFFPRSLKPLLGLEPFLAWCPMGGQYGLVARKPY